MITPLHLQMLAEAVVKGIVISFAVGIPLASFVWAVLRITGRASSGARFAIWYITLLMILFLPLILPPQPVGSRPAVATNSHSLVTVSSHWAVAAFSLWSLVATIGFFRIIVGLSRLRRLRLSCISINPTCLDPTLQDTLRELGPTRRTQLCRSDELSVPTAIGFFRPRIILPSWALQDLSPAQLKPILMHELAHLRRWDDWTNLIQKMVQAILFFHPAMWWIERQISLEREMACDDVVLSNTGNPRAYAQSLLSVAEKSFARRGFSLAQAAVNRMRQTSLRISQILDSNRAGTRRTWKPSSLVLAGASVLGVVIVPHVGGLITFKDKVPSLSAVTRPGISSTPTENLLHVAQVNLPSPRHAARPRSLQTQRTLASVASDSQPALHSGLIEARLLRGMRYPTASQSIKTESNKQAVMTQTVFVVTQFRRDGEFHEICSVKVWRLTVFMSDAPAGNSLPAKKI